MWREVKATAKEWGIETPSKLMFNVVLLTGNRYIKPKKMDWYIEQVLLEDKILQTELEITQN